MNLKKLGIVLFLLMCLASFSMSSVSATGYVWGDVTWNVNETFYVTVLKFNNASDPFPPSYTLVLDILGTELPEAHFTFETFERALVLNNFFQQGNIEVTNITNEKDYYEFNGTKYYVNGLVEDVEIHVLKEGDTVFKFPGQGYIGQYDTKDYYYHLNINK
jgi:hypothetical protein